ncbi:MAG: ABC transporter substrate-binding protein [Desulfomonilia bacterium]
MKKVCGVVFCILVVTVLSSVIFAQEKNYRVEVLQVTAIEPYQQAYDYFFNELEQNGIIEGKNLSVNRAIIDFDVEKGGLWSKIGVLMRIKKEASRIVDAQPDLVLTIGTPATKYSRDKITDAGIPLVFTAVAIPEAAGCPSLTDAGKGCTGATLYMNMKDALQIVKLAFPEITTVGIVHSDDDNAVAHVEEAKKYAPEVGITFLSKEVGKSDPIAPGVTELLGQGAQAFAVPLDTYYGLRGYEAPKELMKISLEKQIPVISFALMKVPGALLYIGSHFGTIGSLSGQQAVKILKDSTDPSILPILKQDDLKILVDTKQLTALNMQLPMEILQLAEAVQ